MAEKEKPKSLNYEFFELYEPGVEVSLTYNVRLDDVGEVYHIPGDLARTLQKDGLGAILTTREVKDRPFYNLFFAGNMVSLASQKKCISPYHLEFSLRVLPGEYHHVVGVGSLGRLGGSATYGLRRSVE